MNKQPWLSLRRSARGLWSPRAFREEQRLANDTMLVRERATALGDLTSADQGMHRSCDRKGSYPGGPIPALIAPDFPRLVAPKTEVPQIAEITESHGMVPSRMAPDSMIPVWLLSELTSPSPVRQSAAKSSQGYRPSFPRRSDSRPTEACYPLRT